MMSDQEISTFKAIARPLRLTLLGLWAERLTRCFWPLWTILLALFSALAFGLQDHLPIEGAWFGLVVAVLGAGWTLIQGLRRFARPTRIEALVRLDSRLPGRPLAALTDTQATGTNDPATLAVWQAHRARMAARAATARAVEPDLRLASRDPFALRYVALTAFAHKFENLLDEVRAGRFREDLFHRLNVMHLVTPPLRERRDERHAPGEDDHEDERRDHLHAHRAHLGLGAVLDGVFGQRDQHQRRAAQRHHLSDQPHPHRSAGHE